MQRAKLRPGEIPYPVSVKESVADAFDVIANNLRVRPERLIESLIEEFVIAAPSELKD